MFTCRNSNFLPHPLPPPVLWPRQYVSLLLMTYSNNKYVLFGLRLPFILNNRHLNLFHFFFFFVCNDFYINQLLLFRVPNTIRIGRKTRDSLNDERITILSPLSSGQANKITFKITIRNVLFYKTVFNNK